MSAPESSAGSSEAREDTCRDYQSLLEDLTFNSKPHINMLTILAKENVPFAKDIVSLIEAQIAKVLYSTAYYSYLYCWGDWPVSGERAEGRRRQGEKEGPREGGSGAEAGRGREGEQGSGPRVRCSQGQRWQWGEQGELREGVWGQQARGSSLGASGGQRGSAGSMALP